MNIRGGGPDTPGLREFLDNLPMRPCPAKLPENYCKMCKRLNGDVYNYCQRQELPPRPVAKPLGEEVVFKRREEKPEEPEKPKPARTGITILERPTYEEGETSLEFVSSQRSIEDAKKSLPRFIPVHKKPKAFRPLEEPSEEEFMAFDLERPSIFKSPEALAEGGEDMMFTLVSDGVEAVEVLPLEIGSEDVLITESVYEGTDGVVETVEIGEVGGFSLIEEEAPVFEFIEEEPEIVEAIAVEEEPITEDQPLPEEQPRLDSMEEAERGIKELADEISGMTEELEHAPIEEGTEEKVSFKQFEGAVPPGETLPVAEPKPQFTPEEAEGMKIPEELAPEPEGLGGEPKEEKVDEKPAGKPKKRLKLKRKLKRKRKVTIPEPLVEEPREEEIEEEKPPEELTFPVEERVAFEPSAGFETTEEEKPKKRLKLKRKLKRKRKVTIPEPMMEEPREEEIEEEKPLEELMFPVEERAAFEPTTYVQPPEEAEPPEVLEPEEEGELQQEEEIPQEIQFQAHEKIEPEPTEEELLPEEPIAAEEGEGETPTEEVGEKKPRKKLLLRKKMKKLKVKKPPKSPEE